MGRGRRANAALAPPGGLLSAGPQLGGASLPKPPSQPIPAPGPVPTCPTAEPPRGEAGLGRSQVTQGLGRAEAETRQPRPRGTGQPQTRDVHSNGNLPRKLGVIRGVEGGRSIPVKLLGKVGSHLPCSPLGEGCRGKHWLLVVAGGVIALLLNPRKAPGTAGPGAHSLLRWLQTPPLRITSSGSETA